MSKLETKEQNVNWIEFKEFVKLELPASSTLKALVLAEPDTLSLPLTIAKLKVYFRMLRKELRGR